jgi:hypothetical protein
MLPTSALAAFFDSLDTLLRVRLAMACQLGAGAMPAELALTGHTVGSICHSLARMADIPGTSLT